MPNLIEVLGCLVLSDLRFGHIQNLPLSPCGPDMDMHASASASVSLVCDRSVGLEFERGISERQRRVRKEDSVGCSAGLFEGAAAAREDSGSMPHAAVMYGRHCTDVVRLATGG
jgi:hypothetical protein